MRRKIVKLGRQRVNVHALLERGSCRLSHRLLIAFLIVISCAAPAPSRAETFAARAGGGLAVAGGRGWAALVGIELHRRTIMVRGEARALLVTGEAEMGFGGLALGLAPARAPGALHPYVLGTLARGLDVREADWATSTGVAVGLDDPLALLGLFVEARYDHLFKDRTSTRHHDLPRNHGTFLVGLRFGGYRSGEASDRHALSSSR